MRRRPNNAATPRKRYRPKKDGVKYSPDFWKNTLESEVDYSNEKIERKRSKPSARKKKKKKANRPDTWKVKDFSYWDRKTKV